MKASNPNMVLVVVGDGPARAEFQSACPQALLVGSKTGDALAKHYASADSFVFPSLTETYGNVTPEALASGLAVLAFDHAAASDLVRHGINGLVRHAVTLATTPLLVQQLRAHAPAAVAQRDWSHIAAQVETIWDQVLLRTGSNHPLMRVGIGRQVAV